MHFLDLPLVERGRGNGVKIPDNSHYRDRNLRKSECSHSALRDLPGDWGALFVPHALAMPFSECSLRGALSFFQKGESMKKAVLSLFILTVLVFVTACTPVVEPTLWDNATYTADATVGEGSKTVVVSIEATEKTVTLTVNTDEANLGAALYSLGLINDPSFFDTLNGITASWEKDKAYWGFYVGDTFASVGVGDTAISGGESFKFVYMK